MITAKGAGVLTAAFAIYLLARLSQVGWLYLVDAVFWGTLVLALVIGQFICRRSIRQLGRRPGRPRDPSDSLAPLRPGRFQGRTYEGMV